MVYYFGHIPYVDTFYSKYIRVLVHEEDHLLKRLPYYAFKHSQKYCLLLIENASLCSFDFFYNLQYVAVMIIYSVACFTYPNT